MKIATVFTLTVFVPLAAACLQAQGAAPVPQEWTFAVSGDSRNCGDFVMPAIASRVRSEGDAFYWHLGDFRAMSGPDQDLVALNAGGMALSPDEYREVAWDDFLAHQMAPFGDLPVFLGRGNHETFAPMTRDRYAFKFSAFLNRPEILAQNRSEGYDASPKSSPWFHFVKDGVDFITLDNASSDEFSYAQQTWLRRVLNHDLEPESGVTTILVGMHEALPHSTSSSHAMDDWVFGTESGEKVYKWFVAAQAAGKHVYLLASHSHFYSPDIYNTPFWQQSGTVLQGWIIGSAGAKRYKLPPTAKPGSETHIYGYLRGTVHADGTIAFDLKKISEEEMQATRWPKASKEAVHECFVNNSE